MKNKKLTQQYDNFADNYSKHYKSGPVSNQFSRTTFYDHIGMVLKQGWNNKLLDLGCGDGEDMIFYEKLGAEVYGIDASKKMIEMAKSKLPTNKLEIGHFENTPYPNNFFNIIVSKYAIQTCTNIKPVFCEILRILKPEGLMIHLIKHPFRQFFEKKDDKADYFEQKVVESRLFGNAVIVQEPTHTMTDYLNNFLFLNFDVQAYNEYWEPAAEFIDGKKYPGFFILKAKKR